MSALRLRVRPRWAPFLALSLLATCLPGAASPSRPMPSPSDWICESPPPWPSSPCLRFEESPQVGHPFHLTLLVFYSLPPSASPHVLILHLPAVLQVLAVETSLPYRQETDTVHLVDPTELLTPSSVLTRNSQADKIKKKQPQTGELR